MTEAKVDLSHGLTPVICGDFLNHQAYVWNKVQLTWRNPCLISLTCKLIFALPMQSPAVIKQGSSTIAKMFETQPGYSGMRLACDAVFKKMKVAALVEAERRHKAG